MNEALLDGNRDGLSAVGGAKLAQDVIDMGLDCAFGNAERVGNLLVAFTGRDQLQYFRLSFGQFTGRDSLSQTLGDGRRDVSLAAAYRMNGGNEFGGGNIFEYVTARPCLDCLIDVFFMIMAAEHHQ